MDKLKLGKYGVAALTLGAFSLILPASAKCATISFTTGPTGQQVEGNANNSFTFTGANISPFTATSADTFFTGSTVSTSFGLLQDVNPASSAANSNVIDVDVASSSSSKPIDFKGTVSAVAVNNTTAYEVNFSNTVGAINTSVNNVSYTELISNGVTYAIQTTQQLNTNAGGGKVTSLKGFVAGVPLGAAPEPASIATTGLAFALAFFGLRRKKQS